MLKEMPNKNLYNSRQKKKKISPLLAIPTFYKMLPFLKTSKLNSSAFTLTLFFWSVPFPGKQHKSYLLHKINFPNHSGEWSHNQTVPSSTTVSLPRPLPSLPFLNTHLLLLQLQLEVSSVKWEYRYLFYKLVVMTK